ncbi:hypothetical protein BURMUCGD1_5619 [Burkholderia multivorans CGD1]|nr:hypothetical protein BURMUCGD1_5619 [Burkholderia multivorans CGD1]
MVTRTDARRRRPARLPPARGRRSEPVLSTILRARVRRACAQAVRGA